MVILLSAGLAGTKKLIVLKLLHVGENVSFRDVLNVMAQKS